MKYLRCVIHRMQPTNWRWYRDVSGLSQVYYLGFKWSHNGNMDTARKFVTKIPKDTLCWNTQTYCSAFLHALVEHYLETYVIFTYGTRKYLSKVAAQLFL